MDRVGQMIAVQKEALELFKKKNADYGDSFANYGQIGVIVRMGDKINRLSNVTNNGVTLVNESVRDTLLPFLPEGQRDVEHLSKVLLTPQLQQSARWIERAIESGAGPSLATELGLDPSASGGNSLKAFLAALMQAQGKKE